MPDAYGNPTEAERRGQTFQPTAGYSGYSPNVLAGVKARDAGPATRMRFINGQWVYDEAPQVKPNGAANAPAFQSAFSSDPFYSRSDVAPVISATNRDVKGGGAFGVRNWLTSHPVGTIAAFIAAAAGGAAALGGGAGAGAGAGSTAAGAGSGAAAGAGAGAGAGVGAGLGAAGEALPEIVVTGHTAAGLTGLQAAGAAAGAGAAGSIYNGSANQGFQTTSDPAASFASSQTGGSAGQLANSGGIGGGAGTGGTTGGALGNASGVANYVGGTGGNVAGGFGSGSGGLWGNLLTLGGSLYNTYQQQQGAKNASRASQAGDAAGLAELRRQYDQSRADQAPWLQAGTAALGRLQDPNAFTQSPGYAFAKNEALNGAQNSAAATGGLFSGNAGRALQDRAANVASLDYNNWFNQQSNLAGLGQTSAQSLGSIGQNSANGVANLLGQQANARASGIVDQTNATTNGLNDVGQWYGNWLRQRQLGGG